MTSQNFFNRYNLDLIESKGLGKIIRNIKTNLGNLSIYEKIVQVIKFPINPTMYGTFLSSDIYSLKNNRLVYTDKRECLIIYFGEDRLKAIDYFNAVIKKDKELKQNLIHKIFGKN